MREAQALDLRDGFDDFDMLSGPPVAVAYAFNISGTLVLVAPSDFPLNLSGPPVSSSAFLLNLSYWGPAFLHLLSLWLTFELGVGLITIEQSNFFLALD